MTGAVRLFDAGTVSPLRSQALYHGLAHAWTPATPDTVVLAVPAAPHLSIGFHQDLEREVDTDYCRARGLEVLRRQVGGGVVYLDRNQLYFQWVMGPERLPSRVEERFRLFARPLVETCRALGVPARFRPVNDVHVAGRKIAGTGAARIGGAEVVVGNLLFDFDRATMARVVRTPSEAFRELFARGLEAHLTTVKEELGRPVALSRMKAIYRERCEAALGARLVEGRPSEEERRAIGSLEARLGSAAFRRRPGGLRRPGLKVHEEVWIHEVTHEAAGRRLRITARTAGERLAEVRLQVEPPPPDGSGLAGLAEALGGMEIEEALLRETVARYHRRAGRPVPGLTPADWAAAIARLPSGRSAARGRPPDPARGAP